MKDEGGVDSRTTCMVCAEVIQLCVPAEQVALFLVYHQLLDQLIILGHVQMVSSRRLSSPRMESG